MYEIYVHLKKHVANRICDAVVIWSILFLNNRILAETTVKYVQGKREL